MFEVATHFDGSSERTRDGDHGEIVERHDFLCLLEHDEVAHGGATIGEGYDAFFESESKYGGSVNSNLGAVA